MCRCPLCDNYVENDKTTKIQRHKIKILNILNSIQIPMTNRELSKKLNLSESWIAMLTKKMYDDNLIKRNYFYNYQNRKKLYYYTVLSENVKEGSGFKNMSFEYFTRC